MQPYTKPIGIPRVMMVPEDQSEKGLIVDVYVSSELNCDALLKQIKRQEKLRRKGEK